MPRQMRIEYAGAIYHVMSRGDRREPIFLDDGDRHDFLKTLAEACSEDRFRGSCLLLDEQPLSSGGGDARGQSGGRDALAVEHLLQPVQPPARTLRASLQRALQGAGGRGRRGRVSANGVRLHAPQSGAGEVAARRKAGCWSIRGAVLRGYLTAPRHRPAWMRVDRLLGEHGIGRDTEAGRREFERRMERAARRKEMRSNGRGCGGDGAWERAIQAER